MDYVLKHGPIYIFTESSELTSKEFEFTSGLRGELQNIVIGKNLK